MRPFVVIAAATIAAAVGSPTAWSSPIGLGDVTDAITAVGGSCSAVPLTHPVSVLAAAPGTDAIHCDLVGIAFQVVVPGPASRRSAPCEAGMINGKYRMLTGKTWIALADHARDLEVIASALTGQGVESQTVNFCP